MGILCYNNTMKKILFFILVVITILPVGIVYAGADTAVPDNSAAVLVNNQGIYKAKVLQVLGEHQESFPNSEALVTVQNIRVQVISGDTPDRVIELVNDFRPMEVGDVFWGQYVTDNSGKTMYVVADQDRSKVLWFLGLFFIIMVIAFGRMQGIRSLVSLGLSFGFIIYILLPLLLQGFSPIPVALVSGMVILALAILLTHGYNRVSLVALAGTCVTVLVTGLLAYAVTHAGAISGLASHESIYLNFNTGGKLDFIGLYLASVIIGMLGVLDDIAITQVAVVREMYALHPEMSVRKVYDHALRVGKDHVGALVNTLVLAYVGVALPTLLYFSQSTAPLGQIINQELFVTEIIRTVVGSAGLILTVPLTTIMAAWLLHHTRGKKLDPNEQGHAHAHGHHH